MALRDDSKCDEREGEDKQQRPTAQILGHCSKDTASVHVAHTLSTEHIGTGDVF